MPVASKSGPCAGSIPLPVVLALFALLAGVPMAFAREPLPEETGFPFKIENLDPSSPVSAAFLNDHVAGSRGQVIAGPDGHLYLAGERIRFMGTNFTSLPTKADAPELARRLAALGVNIIRFHHMDSPWTNGFLANTYSKTTRELDPAALDRLDFFANELLKNGIYLNMNLVVGRQFNRHDGLPPEIDDIEEVKARHAIGFWDNRVYSLQEEFARQLLDRVNPYTGRKWIDEPGLAMVEINNENSLLQAWYNGYLDQTPASLLEGLRSGWQDWLKKKYTADSSLRKTFNLYSPPGPELLVPPKDGRAGRWNLESHGGSSASLTVARDGSLRIEVSKAGAEGWHVQLNQGGLALADDTRYTLSFKARAPSHRGDAKLPLSVSLMMAHDPWRGLGFDTRVELDGQWREYRFIISALLADENARLNFGGLGRAAGALVELKDLSFAPGGDLLESLGSIDRGTLAIPPADRGSRLPAGLHEEWISYLYEVEESYWARMHAFLRDTLGSKALIAGTIVGCTTPDIMARFDIIDTHSYWNHPAFPGKSWDSKDNYVTNTSILRNEHLGGLGSLSFMRIKGKPFSVSEYDHPWPNQYNFEMYPLLAAWACWQDWDMLYTFTADAEDGGKGNLINGFFDQLRNPVKAAAFPFAARIFRQGLVAAAPDETVVHWDRSLALERAGLMLAWSIFGHESLGVDPRLALSSRIALSDGPEALRTAPGMANPPAPGAKRFPVDTANGRFFLATDSLYLSLRAKSPGPAPSNPFPVQPAGVLPDTGAFVMLREKPAPGVPGATSGTQILILNSFAAGNTGEYLSEYDGRVGGVDRKRVNPLDITRIRSTWMRGRQSVWAATPRIPLILPAGMRLEAIGADGTVQPAKESAAMGPADGTLWYVLR